MPILASPAPLPIWVPPSLATEPIGGTLAGSVKNGDPTRHADIVGYVLVRLLGPSDNRWFAAEATYDGATAYADAVADLHTAQRADAGTFRRLMTVYKGGIAS